MPSFASGTDISLDGTSHCRHGGTQAGQIAAQAEAADLALHDVREHRVMPEFLTRMDVGHVQFDHRYREDPLSTARWMCTCTTSRGCCCGSQYSRTRADMRLNTLRCRRANARAQVDVCVTCEEIRIEPIISMNFAGGCLDGFIEIVCVHVFRPHG